MAGFNDRHARIVALERLSVAYATLKPGYADEYSVEQERQIEQAALKIQERLARESQRLRAELSGQVKETDQMELILDLISAEPPV